MADNTRLKELTTELRRQAEAQEKSNVENKARFDRLEAMQTASDLRFNQLSATLERFMQQAPQHNVSHGNTNSGSSSSAISATVVSSQSTFVGHTQSAVVGKQSTSSMSSQPFQVRHIKLEFPRFNGKHVLDWIFKAKQFFGYYNTPDAERLIIASVHLEQEVVPWFQMVNRSRPFQSWNDFTRALELDFGPSIYDCPRASLFKLQQNKSVNEYYMEFTALSNRVYGLSNDALIDCFVSGLKDELHRDVMLHTPISIVKAVSLAKLFEEKIAANSNPKQPLKPYTPAQPHQHRAPFNPTRNDQNQTIEKAPNLPLLPTPPTRPMSHLQKNPAIKRISPAEMQLRREKGLCYFCDDKFSFSHKCPNKQLMLLELDDDPDPPNTPSQTAVTSDTEIQEVAEHHLSLNALKGATGMGVIRFKGYIGPISVSILLDGGSSESFIQPRIVHCLNLPIEHTDKCNVLVGNGQHMKAEGVVRKLSLKVQDIDITVPAYLLPVAGSDVILGAPWLASLGPHVADYSISKLKFYMDGKFVTLQGESDNKPAVSQLNHFRRLQHMNAISELFTIQKIDPAVIEDNWEGMPVNIEPEMATLLHTYREIFQIPKGLPPNRELSHEILLKEGAQPVKVKPYRYPHSQKEQIEKMVQDMLEEGIIQPSLSPFSSPIILVKKKDGTWRCCTDYRALNAITIKDSFPMPTVDELLNELHGAQYFTKLDLRSGYHQILLKPEDRQKTAFRTHQGHYEWLVMPFGLTSAPATFQRLMNQLFQPLLRKCVLVFFDDILVYSPSWYSHLKHVEIVFQILSQNVLYAKLSKCSFGITEVEYLGHVVSGSGVAMDKTKVIAVLEWPTPTNLKQLRGFLGLTGYYRRFIRSYATIAGPLTNLLKKDAFKWDENTAKAFDTLKQAITTAPVLVLPDFSQPFVLETDASGTGVGAVLSQGGHPIAYFSKKMAPRMQLQSAYTREFYAITTALAKFRHYLLGHKFILRTDQKSLKSLLDQSLQTPEQQAWLHKFIGFDFQIEYKPGKDNQAADALSRVMSLSWSAPEHDFLEQLKKEIVNDSHLQTIVQQCLDNTMDDRNYMVKEGLLYWKHRLVIPMESNLIHQILKEYHDTPIGGHAGVTRTLARVTAQFYWPNMRQHIQKFIEACVTCQQAKSVNTTYAGLLQPLPIPEQVCDDVTMDFITGLPYLLVLLLLWSS